MISNDGCVYDQNLCVQGFIRTALLHTLKSGCCFTGVSEGGFCEGGSEGQKEDHS